MKVWFAAIAAVLLSAFPACAQDDLSILKSWRMYSDVENALYNSIADEAYRLLDERDSRLATLHTAKEWETYIDGVRTGLKRAFGPMPAHTPLNARTTATFEHEGITVQNILFESRPGFHVTSSLFRRSDLAEKKLPAILYVCGHTNDGYKSTAYQQVILNLARKGFAVLAFDPVGQGERLQYWDASAGKSIIGGPTAEHSYAGMQFLILGRTMAMVRLWDAVRAVDYLVSRDDIDPKRIGVQGRSGGGTMSSYMMAMDDRIAAAAPECYITSFRRLIQSIGPQDAEQNLLSQIADGLDHGDFIFARAPKPTLIVTTTRDMFSIQGARETVQSAVPAFTALGSPGSIAMIEDDAPHQSTKFNRERVYAFFMKTFNVEGSPADEDIPYIDPLKLQVSESGQVVTSGSRNIHDIVLDDAAPVFDALRKARGSAVETRKSAVLASSKALSRYRDPAVIGDAVFAGRLQREKYSIEKYILDPSGKLPIPALLCIPKGGGRYPAVLLVSSAGNAVEGKPEGFASLLAENGYCVMTVDIPGFGELTGNVHGDDSVIRGVSYNLVFGAQLIGRSITGIQAESIVDAARWLASRKESASGGIIAVSCGITGPALMHAMAFEPSIRSAAYIDSPVSWEAIVKERFYDQAAGSTVVPSALTAYDLSDILGIAAPRDILLLDPAGGDGKPAIPQLKADVEKTVGPYYGSSGHFKTASSSGMDDRNRQLLGWISGLK